jgi:hypothetical protein
VILQTGAVSRDCHGEYGRRVAGDATRASSSLVSCICALTLLLQAIFSGPLPGGGSRDPAAMTLGCEQASCCSAKCYLDENGTHHCVPRGNETCSCGLSRSAPPSISSLPIDIALPWLDSFTPQLPWAWYAFRLRSTLQSIDLSLATPPPRNSGFPGA